MANLYEFRQDLVSGDWVLFATERSKRPHPSAREATAQSKEECPFEELEKNGHEIVWSFPESDPRLTVIKNKYPALKAGACVPAHVFGPYNIHLAIGTHEVLVFKDHDKKLTDFSKDEMVTIVRAYKKRYTELLKSGDCAAYVLLFHNSGKEAGASLSHPHSQIISMPILPPDVYRSLNGAHRYYKEHKRRVYDVLVAWEREEKKRIVYENDFFVAFCPFVSKDPYEVRIFAKDGHAHFEQMPEVLDPYFADVFLTSLKKIKVALNDPPFNFFIHAAPMESSLGVMHEFYTWHVEILPKVKIDAGFELGTGVAINAVDPDDAAELLRNAQV